MRRATFKGNHRSFGGSKRHGRSLRKPFFLMFTLCSLLMSAATVLEWTMGEGSGPLSAIGLGGMLGPSEALGGELGGQLGGLAGGVLDGSGGTKKDAGVVLITPSGDLSDEQRAWLIEQAERGAPIPLRGKDHSAVDAETARGEKLEAIHRALGESETGG